MFLLTAKEAKEILAYRHPPNQHLHYKTQLLLDRMKEYFDSRKPANPALCHFCPKTGHLALFCEQREFGGTAESRKSWKKWMKDHPDQFAKWKATQMKKWQIRQVILINPCLNHNKMFILL